MNINHSQHINLIQKELQFRIYEWEKTLNEFAVKLWKNKSLLLCYYVGYDEARGNILLRFNHEINYPPRKNEYFTCFLSQFQNENVKNWGGLKYEELRTKQIVNFDANIIYVKYEKGHSIVGVSGIKEEQLKHLKQNQLIFLGPSDPPLHYLQNLIQHLSNTNQNNDEILSLNVNTQNWNPQPIKAEEDITAILQSDLIETSKAIIQGPPGTGKTYRVASFIQAIVENGFTVMVTAMTNRALLEVIEKEQLQQHLASGKLYKTNISASERKSKKLKGLKPLRKFKMDNPQVLFTTYYTMSNIALNAIEANYFDFVIVEEASQAYLSTISLARKVGKRCIVVGDKEQLPPIFHKTFPVDEQNNYYWMVNGLSAISSYLASTTQYILKDSFRLSEVSVNCTNAFYNNILSSKSDIQFPLENAQNLSNYFDKYGGISFKGLRYENRTDNNKDLSSLLLGAIDAVYEYDTDASVAVLAFNRNTIRVMSNLVLQKYKDDEYSILVDTIDRIQGLTVDFTIFLIPLDAVGGALDRHRFNVATSRARKGTLIIGDYGVKKLTDIDSMIDAFFTQVSYI